jgi:hypothetical protein
VRRNYHTINKQGKANERKLADLLSKRGQLLLPMVGLIERIAGWPATSSSM